MKLHGWKYKGRTVSEQLHKQFLEIINYLDDPNFIEEGARKMFGL